MDGFLDALQSRRPLPPPEEYLQTAWSEPPELLAAEEAVRKGKAGVAASKMAYLPDRTAYARQDYHKGARILV